MPLDNRTVDLGRRRLSGTFPAALDNVIPNEAT
jgi:hypothetical protein